MTAKIHSVPNFSLLEESDRMMRFLADVTENVSVPLKTKDIWKSYIEKSKTTRTLDAIRTRFRRQLAPKIWKLEDLDDETKVKMIFGTSTPVSSAFLKRLRQIAVVEVDEHGRITKYQSQRLKLSADHRKLNDILITPLEKRGNSHQQNLKHISSIAPERRHYADEDLEMMDYLTKVAEASDCPVPMANLWKVYKVSRNSIRCLDTLNRRFKYNIAPKIHKMPNISFDAKVRLLYVTGTPVDECFLEELRKNAEVDVDGKDRIYYYDSGDMKLGMKIKRKLDEHELLRDSDNNTVVPNVAETDVEDVSKKERSFSAPSVMCIDEDLAQILLDFLNNQAINNVSKSELSELLMGSYQECSEGDGDQQGPEVHEGSSRTCSGHKMTLEEYLKTLGDSFAEEFPTDC